MENKFFFDIILPSQRGKLALISSVKNRTDPQDLYKKFNRATFGFEYTMDHLAYHPVAKVYKTITPSPLQ